MSYSVYYWTAGTKFVGRAFPIILLLEHAKQKYDNGGAIKIFHGSMIKAKVCTSVGI